MKRVDAGEENGLWERHTTEEGRSPWGEGERRVTDMIRVVKADDGGTGTRCDSRSEKSTNKVNLIGQTKRMI